MRKNTHLAIGTILTATALLLQSCNTLSAGRKYTLAKVDRDWSLVEPHRLLEQRSDDMLDEVNPTGNWGLTMNGGFLPFLDSIDRPEVVIFVSVRIREPDEAEHSLLWEHVYLNSEEESEHIALNKNSFLPRDDIALLPPIVYEGQDVFVKIRVIELDQADNQRALQLVNTAASAAATFEPDLGATASVFQTALTYLIENNSDDIEFQYDFALSATPGPIAYGDQTFDNVFNPRVGKYVVIKTEHRDRLRSADGKLDAVGSGLRYGAAEVLKFGTLGLVNWVSGWIYPVDKDSDGGQWDFYHWLFQYPMRVGPDSWLAPQWRGRHLYCQHDVNDLVDWWDPENSGAFHQLSVRGNRIVSGPPDDHSEHLFEQQGYMVFSIVAANNGVDVKTLSDLAQQKRIVDNLAINTSQLSADDAAEHMRLMTKALENYAYERGIRKEYLKSLAAASDDTAIAAVEADYKEKIEGLQERTGQQRTELLRFVDKRAELRRATASGSGSRSSIPGLARLGRANDRIVSERVPPDLAGSGKGPVVRVSYVLSEQDAKDASNLEFRMRRLGMTEAKKLTALVLPTPQKSAFGRTLEFEFEGKNDGTYPLGAYELLVLGLAEGDTRNARVSLWLTPDPVLEDLRTADGTKSLINTLWAKGTPAYLRGENFDFVQAVKITSKGATRTLPVKRVEVTQNDGTTVLQHSIEHDASSALHVDSARLVMVDTNFFHGLADDEGVMLPKVPTNGGLWHGARPVVRSDKWPKDTSHTVKGTGLSNIDKVQLDLVDDKGNRTSTDVELLAENTVKHALDGDVYLVRATLLPKKIVERFRSRSELEHDARQPALTAVAIGGTETALPATLPAGAVTLIGEALKQVTMAVVTYDGGKTKSFPVSGGAFSATTLTKVTALKVELATVTLTSAKKGGTAVKGTDLASGDVIVLVGTGIDGSSKIEIRYNDGTKAVLDVVKSGATLKATCPTAMPKVQEVVLVQAPWRNAHLDEDRLQLTVPQ